MPPVRCGSRCWQWREVSQLGSGLVTFTRRLIASHRRQRLDHASLKVGQIISAHGAAESRCAAHGKGVLLLGKLGVRVSENHFDVVLEELTDRAVGKLRKADIYDASAFDALEDYVWQKAEGLQSEAAISKQILLTLRSAAGAIRSRAEYLPAVREQLHRANDFDTMLDRLIAGEQRSDRQPGIPRII
jgi:hypothetical protein